MLSHLPKATQLLNDRSKSHVCTMFSFTKSRLPLPAQYELLDTDHACSGHAEPAAQGPALREPTARATRFQQSKEWAGYVAALSEASLLLGRCPRGHHMRKWPQSPHGQAHQVQDGSQDPAHRGHLLGTEADHPHGLHHCLVVALLVAVQDLGEKGLSFPGPH